MFDWEALQPLEPALAILTNNGFEPEGLEKAGEPVFVTVEIPAGCFHKTAKYVFKETENKNDPFAIGQSLWIGGMQKQIVDTVVVFTDGPDSGLFLAGYFQNDQTLPFLFAKLTDCELHDRVMALFEDFFTKMNPRISLAWRFVTAC